MADQRPYDPYIPNSSAASSSEAYAGSQRTAALQAQIDDTVGIMRENIGKVSQRGERLDTLQDKTDNLKNTASDFRRTSNKVRKQAWFKDMKWRIILVIGIVVILLVIILPSVLVKH